MAPTACRINGQHKPYTTFSVQVGLRRVLDLTDTATRRLLKLSETELSAEWRTAAEPVETQLLGETVAHKTDLVAIRFPSQAAREAGFTGVNVVIFRDQITVPDTVVVLGDKGETLERLPGAG